MNPNLTIVREAVIKAVPGIMELKAGCMVKKGNWVGSITSTMNDENGPYLFTFITKTPKGLRPISVDMNLEMFEILGHKIGIADVLVALNEKAHDFELEDNRLKTWKLEEDGEHVLTEIWNLLDDDLNHASPECLQFLAGLLANT